MTKKPLPKPRPRLRKVVPMPADKVIQVEARPEVPVAAVVSEIPKKEKSWWQRLFE